MAETPYLETEALLAVMRGDEAFALGLLSTATGTELAALHEYASQLADYVDPDSRCPRCGQYAPVSGSISTGLLGGPRRRWHRDCKHADDAGREAAPAVVPDSVVPDLMANLQASLERCRAERDKRKSDPTEEV